MRPYGVARRESSSCYSVESSPASWPTPMRDGVRLATIAFMDTNERTQALERLKKQREFQTHVVAYLIVNLAVWAIWASTGHGYPWPAWMTGLWGIGLVLNGW